MLKLVYGDAAVTMKSVYKWFESSKTGVGKVLIVLCRSNVSKSLSVPTHPSPPYFYIQQPLKHVNLILY